MNRLRDLGIQYFCYIFVAALNIVPNAAIIKNPRFFGTLLCLEGITLKLGFNLFFSFDGLCERTTADLYKKVEQAVMHLNSWLAIHAAESATLSIEGEYTWDGAAGTYFWIFWLVHYSTPKHTVCQASQARPDHRSAVAQARHGHQTLRICALSRGILAASDAVNSQAVRALLIEAG